MVTLIACPRLFFAQSQGDSLFVARAASNAVQLYERDIRGQSSLYTGSEYGQPEQTHEQHPFFLSEDWQNGSVTYYGEEYLNVGILYDITSDILVIEHYYNGDEMVLVKEKVSSFTLGDREFIHHPAASLPAGLPVAGFYEVMYDGETKVMARFEKQREERIESHEVLIEYTPRSRFFVLKQGEYHRVFRRGDLLKLLADKKQEVRSYINKEKIRVSKKNPGSFAQVVSFYDSLTSGN
jgi:hypothetical protein